jgi:hypothetical protein
MWLAVIDGLTGQVLGDRSVSGNLTFAYTGCGETRLTLRTAPGPPLDVRAEVRGSSVSLSWTNVGAALWFVLDAGFAPGQTALSVFHHGPEGHATFTGVPAGTYYVRVRGGNLVGGGRPSAEVAIVVP